MEFNKKNINSKDWKKFKQWCLKEKIFFKNLSFYSQLFSINNKKINNSFIEFFLYNHFILKNKYDLNLYNWMEKSISANINETISNLFKSRYKIDFRIFFYLQSFLQDLSLYLNKKEKSAKQEYKLLKKYSIFNNLLINKNYLNFNRFFIFINKNIYKNGKGFK